ncbi:hypothetical protein DMO17_03400 [Aquipseudomonas alcaligenes]|uniref:DUF2845 domain-containing protein n=1 Tax=Aquipseudomonas alcaligenes TaxID=43263 RepID=A0A2V4L2L5_AQUAC|nr:DUF2845 domain-containing protein [Pseudomonas alcaligenes]PYC28235.1 hypothetical protein DMO17_03400 [Pseudomonas alcaligenes]
MRGLALLLGALLAGAAQAETLRCGTQLVSVGDRAFEVERKCGVPAYRDLVGYTLGGYDRRELKIEEWVYGPDNGMLSILTFEGNRLTRIERKRNR